MSQAMGYVADVFDDDDARDAARARSAIGHVRYSTAGESRLANAQPILIDCAHGQIAIGHNGNLVNAGELRDELVRAGLDLPDRAATPKSSCTCTRARRRATVEDAIVESVAQVHGAFSLVLLTQGPADRRPRSARLPAARARPARRRLGRLLRDLRARSDRRDLRARRRAGRGAGHQRRTACGRSSRSPPAPLAHCVFEHVYFARPDSYVFGKSVNEVRTESRPHARARGSRSTPTSSCRFPTRACARRSGYAEESGIPLRMGLIRNHYVGRTFIQPQQSIRHFGVR